MPAGDVRPATDAGWPPVGVPLAHVLLLAASRSHGECVATSARKGSWTATVWREHDRLVRRSPKAVIASCATGDGWSGAACENEW